MAFVQAPPHDGDSGAVIVLLEQRHTPPRLRGSLQRCKQGGHFRHDDTRNQCFDAVD